MHQLLGLGILVLAEAALHPGQLHDHHELHHHQKKIVWASGLSVHPRCSKTDHYLDQYEIALISWHETENKAFDPYLICHVPEEGREALDDQIEERLQHLERMGAKLIFHRLSFIDRLAEKLQTEAEEDSDPECIAGTFLRLEIPRILSGLPLQRHDRSYALYTDQDILWWRKVSMNEFMSSIPSSKFSLAYTGQVRREEGPLNTGVLLVNLPIYRKDLPALPNFMFGDFQISTAWDQGVLNKFYDENVGRLRWSVKWNYRMFWDGKDHVAIVHYWAIKPSDALDCWIKKRSLKKCPDIDLGMIPDSLREKFQQQALKMAEKDDHKLSFMKEVMLKYKKYEQLQPKLLK